MFRHVFTSAVLLLLVVVMCGTSEAVPAAEVGVRNVQVPQGANIFVPRKTQVVPKGGRGAFGLRFGFRSPSLARAGGVMAVFASGDVFHDSTDDPRREVDYSDIVAGYIDPAWELSSLLAEVNKHTWRAHKVLSTVDEKDRVLVALKPTTIAKDNKVFLLVRSYNVTHDATADFWTSGDWDLQLLVGVTAQPTEGRPSESITWGEPKSLLSQLTTRASANDLGDFVGGGGSGILMEDGTLVFSLEATKGESDIVSMIMYSTDDGENWVLSEGMVPGMCSDPRITEWDKGQILMVTRCAEGQKVYESRDKGRTWTEAVGTLSGVWAKSEPEGSWDEHLSVEALVTATIDGRKVMLYTQRRHLPGETEPKAVYLWVTNNNRAFHVGPLSVDNEEGETHASTLLYSHDALHLLQVVRMEGGTNVVLFPLTDELQTIKSVLKTWAQLDASFSKSSMPTSGLVGFLSGSSSGDTWVDEFLCVNATVTSAEKVKSGFQFTGSRSNAIWPVNSRENNEQYGFLSHNFALVATVIIHQVPVGSASLLGASLGDGDGKKLVGLSYSAEKKWETVFNGIKTTQSSTWVPGREYQVTLMLQGSSKGSVYVDGQLVGSSETIPTPEARGAEISHFYIGGDKNEKDSSSVTVTNVFLYNRPLTSAEMSAVKNNIPTLTLGEPEEPRPRHEARGRAPGVSSGKNEGPGAGVPEGTRSQVETTRDATSGLSPDGSMDSSS